MVVLCGRDRQEIVEMESPRGGISRIDCIQVTGCRVLIRSVAKKAKEVVQIHTNRIH
jgi:hypothetical protein